MTRFWCLKIYKFKIYLNKKLHMIKMSPFIFYIKPLASSLDLLDMCTYATLNSKDTLKLYVLLIFLFKIEI